MCIECRDRRDTKRMSVALCSGFYISKSLHRQSRLFIVDCTILISLVRQAIATVSQDRNTGTEVTYEN